MGLIVPGEAGDRTVSVWRTLCHDGPVTAGRWTRSAGALGLVGAGALAYALVEAQNFTVRRRTVAALPTGAPPFTILHLSDLHLTPTQGRKIEWLRTLAALDADLVVSTGDHLSHPDAIPVLLDAIDPLLERPGIFVFGSNDYTGPVIKNPLNYLRQGPAPVLGGEPLPVEDLRDGLTASGWLDANNERANLSLATGVTLDVVGVDDPHIGLDRYADVAGPRSPEADLLLGVTHAPYLRVLDAMAADGCDLVLAGHTHGGQVCLPGYGTLVTNCDLDRARARGLSTHPADRDPEEEKVSWLHVSAGVGTSPYTPIRVACRPEAVLLTLIPRSRDHD
jgi:predicted MPP superfamily phosphohydrolase